MNKFFITGTLTADPELTETNEGVSVCRFSMKAQNTNGESNRNYSGGGKTSRPASQLQMFDDDGDIPF